MDLEALSREELIVLCRQLQEAVAHLTQRVAELEKQLGAGGPPSFVRPNVPKRPKDEAQEAGPSLFPSLGSTDRDSVARVGALPGLRSAVAGRSVHRRRQVIEIAPSPVRITEHQIIGRWGGVCKKRVLPRGDLSAEVVGKHRVGVGLMSWIGLLHITARLPLRSIQRLLASLFGLHLGLGELSELLHTLAQKGEAEKERLLGEVRGSPYVHADETGWREDGQNGYLWSFSTPSVRCFVYDKSRSGDVAVEALGEEFAGICVSDFYCAYNKVGLVRQRCWVHLLRDLHKLSEACSENVGVQEWVGQVRCLYEEACAYRDRARAALERFGGRGDHVGAGVFDRQRQRQRFERELYALTHPYLRAQCSLGAPQTVLSQRIESFLRELFVFVEHPEVPSENNAAERSLRPAVIDRKISGGTRSAKGSQTKTTLMTLFQTWQVQGKDPLQECRRVLTALPA